MPAPAVLLGNISRQQAKIVVAHAELDITPARALVAAHHVSRVISLTRLGLLVARHAQPASIPSKPQWAVLQLVLVCGMQFFLEVIIPIYYSLF